MIGPMFPEFRLFSTMLPQNRLRELTDMILSAELHYGKVRQACNELYDLFKELSGFEGKEHVAISDIYFDAGMAVRTSSAAFCLIDFRLRFNYDLGLKPGFRFIYL